MSKKLILLGVGNSARAVARAATGYAEIIGTTRSIDRLPELEEIGIDPILVEVNHSHLRLPEAMAQRFIDADVLVSYPPDKQADDHFASLAQSASSIVYISSTGVYGKLTGKINENSPVDDSSATAVSRLQSEEIWRGQGAIVLRAPGLYDSHTGLHRRLQAGNYRIPGDGTNYVSRIHLDDLARIILAAFRKARAGSTYVVGDKCPATHLEVAQWICQLLKLELPPMVPLSEVHETLRGSRQVCAEKVLKDLEVELKFPSYKEGYSAGLTTP